MGLARMVGGFEPAGPHIRSPGREFVAHDHLGPADEAEHVVVQEPLPVEGLSGDVAVDQCEGDAHRHGVIRGLARSRTPQLGFGHRPLVGGAVGDDPEARDVVRGDVGSQLQGSIHR